MKTKRNTLFFLLLSVCIAGIRVDAQDLNFDESIRRLIEHSGKNEQHAAQDTIRKKNIDPQENISVQDTVPVNKDTVPPKKIIERPPLEMSDEALYWSRYARSTRIIDPSMTFRDLIIVNPLFMPLLFREGNILPVEEIKFYQPYTPFEEWQKPLVEPVKTLEKAALRLNLQNMAYYCVQRNNMNNFRYIADQLPSETTHFIYNREKVKPVHVKEVEADPTELPSLPKFIPDRRYWTSSFTSDVKFSQAYVSPNWHKGGSSNFNVLSRSQLHYNYAKNRMQLKNLVEINASVYTTSNDTIHNYRFSEDIFRVYTNLGYKAFSNKWFYTLDFEFKTPLFTNYQENTRFMQTALLSPFTVNLGVGLKYDLTQKFPRKDRSVTVGLNLAPLSFSYMYSMKDTIDLGRHGFPMNATTGRHEHVLSKFGSTLRFDMVVKPNRDVTWKSRFYYFTSYDRIVGEFENSLDLAISRYFSTLINLYMRYDDGVSKRDDYNTFFQTNEVLSFGFSYKW
ncbi:MAG: DUF3078 domain-containing protein [Tannerella sp.]|jgi:hypothetical protein|nr:DUF3078 domain-containing protein [Tannerella sp.]